MLPVSDLERSLAFYAEFFGFYEIRRIELEQPSRTVHRAVDEDDEAVVVRAGDLRPDVTVFVVDLGVGVS